MFIVGRIINKSRKEFSMYLLNSFCFIIVVFLRVIVLNLQYNVKSDLEDSYLGTRG